MTNNFPLLITDLDNTLYDWVTFHARAFRAMVDALVELLVVPRELVLDEFQQIHRRYGTSEPPFAVLELPSVTRRFGSLAPQEIVARVKPALDAFDAARREQLRLYPGVGETLRALRSRGTRIVGHTEAMSQNAVGRLRRLEILPLFDRLYVLESRVPPHPFPDRLAALAPPEDVVRRLPLSDRKPNPRLLGDISVQEHVPRHQIIYVGDSLTRDVQMAKDAGVIAVWARYGTRYDAEDWDLLVRVTHWTEADVAQEIERRKHIAEIKPDLIIESFDELLDLGERRARA